MFTDVAIEPIIQGFVVLFPVLMNLLFTVATAMGVFMIYKGIVALVEDNPQITQQMAKRNMLYKLFSGALLITSSFQIFLIHNDFFPETTNETMASAIDQEMYRTISNIGPNNNYFYSQTAAQGFAAGTILLGLFAMLRGFHLIGQRGSNGSLVQRETTGLKIATHIIGGFLLAQLWRLV